MNSGLVNFTLGYLVYRFFFRITAFLHHWYIDGSRTFLRAWLTFLTNLESTLALRITLFHLSEPLYKDYSLVGRIIGPIFRLFRVVLGLVLYAAVSLIFMLVYLFWILLPPYLLLEPWRLLL